MSTNVHPCSRGNHESKKALQLNDLGRRLKEEYEKKRAAECKRAEEKNRL